MPLARKRPHMHYQCPKKNCAGGLEYMHSTERGDKYVCDRCGKAAWYEGNELGIDIPGI